MRPEDRACSICGHDRPGDVRMGLVRREMPDRSMHVEAAPRCADRAACRRRVEAAGGAWDVADAEDRP